jgi:aminomethyltransferase
MPLYGHEINEQTNPYEAGLGRVVKLEKGEFVGRSGLAELSKAEPKRRLVGFQMVDGSVPRQGYEIRSAAQTVGSVTSGTFSPTLKRGIGMAYVPPGLGQTGESLDVVVRDRLHPAVVSDLPHVPHHTRRIGRQG